MLLRIRLHPVRLVAASTCGLVLLTSCTDAAPPEAPSTQASSPGPSTRPTSDELTDKQRATQLTALAPDLFDATYTLKSRGKRPDAEVEMRADGDRFRLDVTKGRESAVLFTSPRGVVSCQIRDVNKGKNERSCFLVAKSPKKLPNLFDPKIQRLFRGTTSLISRTRNDLRVKPAKPWRAPAPYGMAECFDVQGAGVSQGTYCYLAKPGPFIGLLARAKFGSGTLSIRSVNRVIRTGAFKPPVRPTPLP